MGDVLIPATGKPGHLTVGTLCCQARMRDFEGKRDAL